jgi:hypothetical protein
MAGAMNPERDLTAIRDQDLLDFHRSALALTQSLPKGERSRFDKLNVSASRFRAFINR